jgi:Fic family protein
VPKQKKIPFDPAKPANNLDLLPPGANIESTLILKQLTKAAVALAELKGLINTLPNPYILLNAIVLQEAEASSEIENVVTTQDKLYQALNSKSESSIDPATKEVLRYREALLHGLKFIEKKGFLNTNCIIEIQAKLEENSAGIRKLPGTTLTNTKTGKVIYTPPDNHESIVKLLKNLEDYINIDDDEVSALIKMAIQHYQFESIHPFYDGNGRTGRIMNILYLILKEELEQPILYLSKYIIKNKGDYYRLLQEVRTKNSWEEWILFILKGIEITSNETKVQINKINKLFLKTEKLIKTTNLKTYNKELLELLYEHPYSKVEYVVKRLAVSRITATKYLQQLVDIGILEVKPVWKENLYVNKDLFRLLKSW